MEKLLSRAAVAAALAVSDQTVDRLIAAGILKSFRVGKRRIAIGADSLDQYIQTITHNQEEENKR